MGTFAKIDWIIFINRKLKLPPDIDHHYPVLNHIGNLEFNFFENSHEIFF